VLTVHEPDPYLPTLVRRYVLNPIQVCNLKALARFADRYIVHCDALKDSLSPHVPDTNNIWTVPHGDLSPFFTQWATNEARAEREILFFGRAAPGKGLPELIKAGRRLADRFSDITITIAGSGYDPEQFGSLPTEHFTVIDSRVSEREAARLFERAAVVAMPYLNASTSGIPSIAGGFSTPVVATDVGCLPSLVKHKQGGLIVEPNDAEALYDALVRILESPNLRDEMGRELGRIHESKFSWERIAEMTIDVYAGDHDEWRPR
jgi:glycosyltransferase involved in cell wall biosynthesis